MSKQTIEIMKSAQFEIQQLRRTNEVLAAKVEVFDQLMCLFHTKPAERSVGLSPDVVFMLEKEVMQLEKEAEEARQPQPFAPKHARAYEAT